MIDNIFIEYNGPAVEGPRVRKITNWKLHKFQDKYFLTGITISENEIPINDRIRFTQTSTIEKRINRTLITESGSHYTLMDPHLEQDPDQYLIF